jgi:DNA-cytosine methyltransferase
LGIKVLSLFDGMSCGQIALDQLGIEVDKYYASEIDKYAIQITQKNYPKTIQVGDICELDPKDFQDVDLIMGGSPCQGFSFAGKQLAFDDPRSKLFFEFVRMVEGVKPKYFLLENVRMKKEYLQVITDMLGVEPIFINSALVSAQSRQRYYWTNIPNIKEPEDRGIVLKDILENDFSSEKDKSYCIDANYFKGASVEQYKKKSRRQLVSKPKQVGIATDINGHDILKRVYSPEGKSPTLNTMGGGNREPKVALNQLPDKSQTIKSQYYKSSRANFERQGTFHATGVQQEDLTWRKLTPLECERLQTVPDNYTDGVSNTQRYKMLGNGWTVEVIKHILGNMA